MKSAVGLLLLTIDLDIYAETPLSRYSDDQICRWIWKH